MLSGGSGEAGRMPSVSIRAPFRTNDGHTLVDAAVAGHGIIFQPCAVDADALAAGSLMSVLAQYVEPSRPMHLTLLATDATTSS